MSPTEIPVQLEIANTFWSKYGTFISTVAGVLFTVAGWVFGFRNYLLSRRDKKIAEQLKADEQRRISRAGGPFLRVFEFQAHRKDNWHDWAYESDMEKIADRSDHAAFECHLRMHNDREKVVSVRIESSDIRAIRLEYARQTTNVLEKTSSTTDNLHCPTLIYEFEKSKLGLPFNFDVYFEAPNGLQLKHTYESIHGKAHLKRIDPK